VGYSPGFIKRHQGAANFFSDATPTPGCTILCQIGVITIINSTASRSGGRDRRRNGGHRDLPGSDDEGHHPIENRRKLLGVDAAVGEGARGHSAEGAQNRNFHPSKSTSEIEIISMLSAALTWWIFYTSLIEKLLHLRSPIQRSLLTLALVAYAARQHANFFILQ
jgi:hypothetical protein